MFIGRRPGTAPIRYRPVAPSESPTRRRVEKAISILLLAAEVVLCVSLWGPQPLFWLWAGSYVEYFSGFPTLGIFSAFAGMLFTLLLTLSILKRIDLAWKLVRRAAGYEQHSGALEWIFVVSLMVALSLSLVWYFLDGPQPSLAPR